MEAKWLAKGKKKPSVKQLRRWYAAKDPEDSFEIEEDMGEVDVVTTKDFLEAGTPFNDEEQLAQLQHAMMAEPAIKEPIVQLVKTTVEIKDAEGNVTTTVKKEVVPVMVEDKNTKKMVQKQGYPMRKQIRAAGKAAPQMGSIKPLVKPSYSMNPKFSLLSMLWISAIVLIGLSALTGYLPGWMQLATLGLMVGNIVSVGSAPLTQRELPDDLDFYWLSNEDIGFIATLVADTNDIFAFSLPYPAGINLFTETIFLYACDFLASAGVAKLGEGESLHCYMSMLDLEFAADWDSNFSDAEDPNLKAHFDGPYNFGSSYAVNVPSAEDRGSIQPIEGSRSIRWWPMQRLRLATPLFVQFVNSSVAIALATYARTQASFTGFEGIAIRPWFTITRLSRDEMTLRGSQIRWQQLNS